MSNSNKVCGCMGPMDGNPYCPCDMKRLGLVCIDAKRDFVNPEKFQALVNSLSKKVPNPLIHPVFRDGNTMPSSPGVYVRETSQGHTLFSRWDGRYWYRGAACKNKAYFEKEISFCQKLPWLFQAELH